ncbi:MAG: sigma-70 family RNA polymerase sigma factor [Bdellovibrionales bacterium]|nr:sigma-70 family RNA polymerase sigma factor [Bdellovibrionales bacterium]
MANPFSHLEDDKLMELYKNGENMAFEVIYSRHKDRVYSYLYKRFTDLALIEDTFQSIFTKFHKSRHLYSSEHLLIKWIYTICRSELLDAVKKNKVSLVELKEEHIVSTPKENEESINLDKEKSLSIKEREALKLRYFSDEDFAEISRKLETSETNSRKLVSRGLKKLRTKFLRVTND